MQKEGHLEGLEGHYGRTETKFGNFGMGFEKMDGHFGVRRVFLKGTGTAKDGQKAGPYRARSTFKGILHSIAGCPLAAIAG